MLIDLLRDLVAIDSVNPSLVTGARGEQEVATFCASWLARAGLDVQLQEAAPGRPNVVAVLDGHAPGPTLMLCGHLDTVGVAGMLSPFDPRVQDRRLYGRGSQDMKGGVAAMMEAARRVAPDWKAGRLIVACVVDEEYESIGAQALVGAWKADAAVVTEPTALSVAVTHKGFAWITVETLGRAAHGSRPAEGRDAILYMGRVLAELEKLNIALSRRQSDPLTGPPSLHASIIDGGREWSVYPDRCVLRLERRTVVGEADTQVLDEIERLLDRLRAADPAFTASLQLETSRPPYAVPPAHPFPEELAALVKGRGGRGDIAGMSFWTDAAILGEAGIATVLFGPGGAGLHSVEEYVELDDVEICASTLADLARSFCGSPRR